MIYSSNHVETDVCLHTVPAALHLWSDLLEAGHIQHLLEQKLVHKQVHYLSDKKKLHQSLAEQSQGMTYQCEPSRSRSFWSIREVWAEQKTENVKSVWKQSFALWFYAVGSP